MKTVVPQWRIEELQLARYLNQSISEIETMPCVDFYDAQEYMFVQMHIDGIL